MTKRGQILSGWVEDDRGVLSSAFLQKKEKQGNVDRLLCSID
ncbi:hypothetical protein JOC95_004204 [Bacillus tianshenii]|uniref:Uncharacterized protein n=1 Tax=Sutcliffiella tianshenii TaxID=1463404 RepID=A0ABS2P5P3_9BACI|nr:hypothetical protein [Bacillus tianshenii]